MLGIEKKLNTFNKYVAYIYWLFLSFLTVRLCLFGRGIFGIPDALLYMVVLIAGVINALVLVLYEKQINSLLLKTIIAATSAIIMISVLLSIYVFIGPEARPHWETGDWKW